MNSKAILKGNMQRLKTLKAFDSNVDLARKIHVSSRTINLIFNDDEGNPTLSTIDSIAKTLKIPSWALLFNNFPFKDTDNNRDLMELIGIIGNISNEEVKDILKYAKLKENHNKVKESLAKYDPQNPLLKA